MSRRGDAGRPPGAPRGHRGHGAEFAAVDNQIHFHPDPRLGGLAILVLLRRSALRPAGVHLLDSESHTWRKAADVDDLAPGAWIRLRDECGRALPVEVRRTPRMMCVRWLGPDGSPVEPSPWDRGRIRLARTAMAGPVRLDVKRFGLTGGCPA